MRITTSYDEYDVALSRHLLRHSHSHWRQLPRRSQSNFNQIHDLYEFQSRFSTASVTFLCNLLGITLTGKSVKIDFTAFNLNPYYFYVSASAILTCSQIKQKS